MKNEQQVRVKLEEVQQELEDLINERDKRKLKTGGGYLAFTEPKVIELNAPITRCRCTIIDLLWVLK